MSGEIERKTILLYFTLRIFKVLLLDRHKRNYNYHWFLEPNNVLSIERQSFRHTERPTTKEMGGA